jgi:hypothetical protein
VREFKEAVHFKSEPLFYLHPYYNSAYYSVSGLFSIQMFFATSVVLVVVQAAGAKGRQKHNGLDVKIF